jgi:agmatinase
VIEAVDAGDVPCSSFDIDEALQQIADAARVAIEREQKFLADAGFGSSVIRAGDFDRLGAAEVVGRARERVGDAPVNLSVDSNVREPACAPGTGTPERGGFTSRELLALLRGMPGEQLVAADVIDVNSAHGHARTTSLAGVSVADETTSRMAGGALSAPGAQA